MATVTPSEVLTPISKEAMRIYKWAAVAAADTCTPQITAPYSDVTVYMYGTFGGNMSLEGSPDPNGTTFVGLTDPQGNAIATKSAAFVEAVLEGAYKMRPVAGAGVGAVDVFLVCRSTR